MARHCTNCGAALREGVKFCEECGTRIPEEKPRKLFCTSCGKELSADAAFCRFCGAKREGSGNGPSSPAPPSNRPERSVSAPADRIPADAVPPATPSYRPERNVPPVRQTPSYGRTPDYMQPGYRQQVSADRQAAQQPKVKKSRRGFSLFLALLLAVQFCIAGFKYPGFLLRDKKGDPLVTGGTSGGTAGGGNGADTAEYTGIVRDVFESLGLTEEDFYAYLADPIEATPENSPGNPAFIEVSFTDAERASAPVQTAAVSREHPEADFPDFGIHIDLKRWNLENEEDTLIVKRLPAKTDAVTGLELYTYDYSLASGQHEFYTPVEVTVPIQGDPYAFEGVAYRNEGTGVWETVYYELSEDGKSYTAHMTHFSDDAQLSIGQQKVDQMKADGLAVTDFYKENGETLFRIMPYQDLAKYPDSHTWLWGIGLTKIPNLEQFMRKQTAQSLKTYSDLMQKTGGITAEAGNAEAYGALGGYTDTASTGQFLISQTEFGESLEKLNGKVWNGAGHILTLLGLYCLYWRIVDQVERGVSWSEIFRSNGWNFVSAAASVTSLLSAAIIGLGTTAAVAAGATTAGGVAAAVGAAVFFITKAQSWKEEYQLANKPLGDPKTIEEGAYHYFLSDYGWNSVERPEETRNESAAAFAFLRLIKSDRTAYDETHAPAYHTLDIRGNGWAFALQYLFEKYQNDPEKLASMVQKLYDEFLNCFWTDQGNNTGVKYTCWQHSAQRIIDEGYRSWDYFMLEDMKGDLKLDENGMYSDYYKRAVDDYGEDEVMRRVNIGKVLKEGRTIDDLFDGRVDREAYVRFNKLTQSEIDAMTEKARGVLYRNTNAIVYGIYRKYYNENMKALSDRLYFEVLPWLNTRVTFYKRDLGRDVITSADSKYTMFEFTDFSDGPLFSPANAQETYGDKYVCECGLILFNKPGTPVLLETNVYHYLRFGCPTQVKCMNPMREVPDLTGTANWDSVNLRIDENSLWNALPEKYQGSGAGKDYQIKDMRVPVEYNAPKKFNVEATGANSPTSFPLYDEYIFEMFFFAFNEACKNADGTIDNNGNVSFTGTGTYEYDFNQKGKATVTFTATGTIDPKSKEGTCTVSGSGNLSDADNDYNWMDQKVNRNVSVKFTGSGSMYGMQNGKFIVFEQADEVKCKTENTQFTFTGSYVGHDRLRDETISGRLDAEYTLDHYGGWGVSITRK